MKIVDASYNIIKEPSITKKIEQIARLCYKSEDQIKEGSDLRMIKALVKHKHLAMLEHGSLAFIVDHNTYALIHEAMDMTETYVYEEGEAVQNYLHFSIELKPIDVKEKLENDEKFEVTTYDPDRYIISGNMRAWINAFDALIHIRCLPTVLCDAVVNNSNGIMDDYKGKGFVDLDYDYDDVKYKADLITDFSVLSPGERMIHENISVLFTVDRGVTHEMVRHRDCSFAQESTRYVNYSNGKYGGEITVVKPCFFDVDGAMWDAWEMGCSRAEDTYIELIEMGASPQEARTVLPTSTKAEIVMTASLKEWHHILSLRACHVTGPSHPQIAEVMEPLLLDLKSNGYLFAFDDLEIPEKK